jgi:hypothetical protein
MENATSCTCKHNHKVHICNIIGKGANGSIDLLINNPRVKCEKCGAEANSGSYVCVPVELPGAG